MNPDEIAARLEYLRGELRAERISYGELLELQNLAEHIAPGDVELLEAAGVPEAEYRRGLMNTGERIDTVTVELSKEAFTVLCGLVQPNWLTSEDPDAVNHGGIYSEAWEELRATFPLEQFRKVAQERGEDFYHEEAGT